MTLDDVLVRHIGHFGRFQGVALFLTVLSSLPAGWHILAYIFISGGTQDYWCALPTGSFGNASQEQLKDIFIPSEIKNGKRKFSSCEIYDFDIKNVSKFTLNILRSGDLVNGSDVRGNISDRRRCVQWEYENNGRYSSSILTQYELYCEKEWLIPVSQSCIMAGWLLGNFVFGSLADRFGRMRVIPVGFLMTFVIGLIMPFIPNYYAYILFRFFLGVTTGGSYTVCFVLLLEYCGTKHRVLSNISFHGGFNGAVVLLSGIAYAMAPVNHITMQIILGCVPFCMIFYKFILVESPRWLVSNQQYDEARKNIRKIAKFNGRPLADDVVLAFPQDRALINGELKMVSEHPEKKYTVLDLFRTPNIRRATLASYVQWFACSFIFYGLIFIGGSLGANVYINTAISGLCGVVGGFASLPVLKYLGRRTTGVSSLFIMTISLFASIFLIGKPEYETSLVGVVFVGKFFNIVAFDTIYLHSAECFPTCMRTLGVGTGSLWARVGALLSPFIAKTATIWPVLPVIVFCSSSAVATCMALLLPETRGRHLPETVEEGERFARLSLSCPWSRVNEGEKTDIDITEDSNSPC